MNELAPMLIVSIIAAVICTAALYAGQTFWTRRGWSETARPAALGVIMIVAIIATMVPGLLFLDKVHNIMHNTPVTTLELPEVEHYEYQPWGAEFNDDDEHCLALNIYFEARGEEDDRGKYAVADVVMYRFMHASYPDTVCGVVQEGIFENFAPVKHRCQFSWFCDGKSDRPVNTTAFNEAIDIAQEVLHNPSYEPRVEYSLFYHATTVKPRWSKKREFVETIGNHSFYK